MGIRVRPLTAELRERLGIEDAALMGLVITDIAPGSAGAEAGLQPGDVITRVQQQDVSTVAQFRELMAQGQFPDGWVEETHKALALKNWGRSEDIGYAASYLASSRAAYVTGQQISVSGGFGL